MRLTPHDIAKMLDHSTLQPFLTDEDIRKGCELPCAMIRPASAPGPAICPW